MLEHSATPLQHYKPSVPLLCFSPLAAVFLLASNLSSILQCLHPTAPASLPRVYTDPFLVICSDFIFAIRTQTQRLVHKNSPRNVQVFILYLLLVDETCLSWYCNSSSTQVFLAVKISSFSTKSISRKYRHWCDSTYQKIKVSNDFFIFDKVIIIIIICQ